MDELLQRLSSLSGQEYGLLEVLVRSGFLSREQLSRWVEQVVDDRLALAETYLVHAQACDLLQESECRQAISRAYYTCHHAGRALVYEVQRRDVETHQGVITGVRQILSQETAHSVHRLHRLRNQVEYELYLPMLDLQVQAQNAVTEAGEFLNECREFVVARR